MDVEGIARIQCPSATMPRVLFLIRTGAGLASITGMTADQLKKRTKTFAVAIVRFAASLPRDPITEIIARQLVRSGTSIGANYRSSCRAKSRPDFVAKLTIAEEEADETLFWLEILVDASIVRRDAVEALLDESEQLLRIFVASIKTARGFSR